jgi:pyruvate kinase
MARVGVHGFRVNFAHGEPAEWKLYVDLAREAEAKVNRPIALIGDLPGPSIRVGVLDEPIRVGRGEEVVFELADRGRGGDDKRIPLPVPQVFEAVDPGDIVVMDDGRVRLRVVDKTGSAKFTAIALTDAVISSRKALVVQGKEVELPVLSERDMEALSFAIRHGFDYVGLSYVRKPDDVNLLRELIERRGGGQAIIAKIETRSAIENLSEIVRASDAVLVARGDLGMNFGLEEVHRYQKLIIETSLRLRRPVILATQLLESMRESPVPTRAEVVDVSTAVEMGVDALMLTGETAVGKHPIEAVKWLTRIVSYAEHHFLNRRREHIELARSSLRSAEERLVKALVDLSEELHAKLLVYTVQGATPKRIASMRPTVQVYVGSSKPEVLRKLAILWGVEPVLVEAQGYSEGLRKLLTYLVDSQRVSIGDTVVLAFGVRGWRQRIEIVKLASLPREPSRKSS